MALRGCTGCWLLFLVICGTTAEWSEDSCSGYTCSKIDTFSRECQEWSSDWFDLRVLRDTGLLAGGPIPDAKEEGISYYASVCRPVEALVPDRALTAKCEDAGGDAAASRALRSSLGADGSADCTYLGVPQGGTASTVHAVGRGVSLGPYAFWSCEADVCLTYGEGEVGRACTRPRQVTFAMTCAGEAGQATAFETSAGSCHYVVRMGHPAGWGWAFNFAFSSAVSLYLGLGMAYKVKHKGHNFGVEAVPNVEFWRALPGYVRDGIEFSHRAVASRLGAAVAGRGVQGEKLPGYSEMS